MIVLNMIARNCAGTVINALESVKAAVDFYVIGFAGESKDLTRETVVEWLETNAPARFVVDEFEFRNFSDARNRVMDMTPQGFREAQNAWLVWVDTDDVVLGASELPGILEKMPPEVGAVQFPYVYQTDENGNPLVVHDRERCVRFTYDFRWWRPVHETLRTERDHRIVRFDNLTWVHNWKANETSRHERNLELLKAYLEENPDDARTILYIGHAHYSAQEWEKALAFFSTYYYNPENILEQWQAAVFAGDCCFTTGDLESAIGWYMQAIDVLPQVIDPFLGIAACYARQDMPEKALEWYAMADGKQMPPSQLFVLPGRYTFNRWCYEHFALAGTGQFQRALEVCDKAIEYTRGKHLGFVYFRNGYREQLDQIKSKQAFAQIVQHLQQRGDALNALEVLNFAPKPLNDDPEFLSLRAHTERAIEHLFGKADIYSGEECWAGSSAGSYEQEPEQMPRVQAVFDVLAKHAEKKRVEKKRLTILDIGCGDGSLAIRAAEKFGYLVTGIDTNEANIERAKKRAEERGVADKTRFLVADARQLDLEAVGMHDVALCLEVIEHVIDPAMLATAGFELADVLIITTPHQVVGDELRNTPDGVHLHHVREFDFGMMVRLTLGVGGSIETLDTVYARADETALPGYGQWLLEANKTPPTKMPVVFYVGASAENWKPTQIDSEGIGGSETAVVQMAKLFREAGHSVFVYGPVDGVWDGVFYRHYKHFYGDGPAAGAGALLFVSSRVPEVFDVKINAAVKVLWAHDNTFKFGARERLTPERAEEIDSILVLSDWQKRKFEADYPFAASKLVVTANGIDPTRFASSLGERDQHKFVWSSSYDRGLERVLDMWPAIREKMPDATLDVYYGWETADKVYGSVNKVFNEFRGRLTEKMKQAGITHKGRVSQKELAKQLYDASYWLYPTDFAETYCITALEMQAAGVIPVTSNVGALPERMAEGIPTILGDDDAYLDMLAEYDEKDNTELRSSIRKYALRHTWAAVHKQWKRLIDKKVKANIAERRKHLRVVENDQDTDAGVNLVGAGDGRRGQ